MSRMIDKNLGKFMPETLEPGSAIMSFYNLRTAQWKRFMKSHWSRFIWTIK
jgi:hypothetical protein